MQSIPIQFFLIHAPDTSMEAAILNNLLKTSGFPNITYHQAYEGWMHSQIEMDIYPALDKLLALVFIGSPQFFADGFLTELAHEAHDQKKAIYITLHPGVDCPDWFSSSSISLSNKETKGEKGKNGLIHRLNRFTSYSRFSHEN